MPARPCSAAWPLSNGTYRFTNAASDRFLSVCNQCLNINTPYNPMPSTHGARSNFSDSWVQWTVTVQPNGLVTIRPAWSGASGNYLTYCTACVQSG